MYDRFLTFHPVTASHTHEPMKQTHIETPVSLTRSSRRPWRSPRDLVTAEQMLRKLKGQLCGPGRPGPSRALVLRQAVDASTARSSELASDFAFEKALDRLLDELEQDEHQPLPFSEAASRVEAEVEREAQTLRLHC